MENIRNVAVMFDTMVEQKLIGWNWKIVMANGKHLLSKTGKPISASSLSSALAEIKKHPTAMSKSIAQAIRRIAVLSEDHNTNVPTLGNILDRDDDEPKTEETVAEKNKRIPYFARVRYSKRKKQ